MLLINKFRFFCKTKNPPKKDGCTVREFNRNDASILSTVIALIY
ncbi:hypothetical protein CHPC929_0031 [Streptococcus phage CHPC929]|nr:hypothetical protein CHPC929_0031 [Streptococcus phage CHPC929]